LLAGAFYAKRESLSPTMAEPKLVELAVQRLGLSQLETFDPSKKIIEYQL